MTDRARPRPLKLAAVVLGTVFVAASCAADAPQDTLQPQGPAARQIDNLIMPVFAVAGVVFVIILGGALYVALKFRARDDDDYDTFPAQVHGNFKLEIGWTIVPAVILAFVGFFTVLTIFDLAQQPGEEALEVEVYGQQWWWEYRYDIDGDGNYEEIITANDLVIPAGREISLNIKARDVIHSFWAPGLNGKKDAVPGRTHPLTIEADEPGEYLGQCTEYCGLSHAEMRIKVIAVTDDEFDAWTEDQQQGFEAPTEESAIAGWSAFAGQCTNCHEIQDMPDPASADDPAEATELLEYPDPEDKDQVAGAAPDLTHFMSRTTFAGAKFDLRLDTEECRALGLDWADTDEGIEQCLNRNDLAAWLRNAPAQKAMFADEPPHPLTRGMPNFNLTEDQINDLVAFLITLK
jgi:cytochrome c oxidase subunit II